MSLSDYQKYQNKVEELLEEADISLKDDVSRISQHWYKAMLPSLTVNIADALAKMLKNHPQTSFLSDEEIEIKRKEALPYLHEYIKNHMAELAESFYPQPANPDIIFFSPYLIGREEMIKDNANLENLADDLVEYILDDE